MAYTQAQLFALESARAQGLLEVTYPDGTKKTYRSDAEMKALINEMRLSLGQTSNTSRRRVAEFHRGLD